MASSQQQSHLGGARLTRASTADPASIPNPTRIASQNQRHDGQFAAHNAASMQSTPTPTTALQRQSELTPASESWVEIASQPSSSSLSSIGDEIVTTGLHVGNQPYPPRRRRLQHHYNQSLQQQQQMPQSHIVNHSAGQAGASSQEEYEETESEDDRLMTSSTENINLRPATGLRRSQTANPPGAELSDSEDDDEGTALGRPTPQPFRPQPNAFSHPPSQLNQRSHSTTSAIPIHHPGSRPAPVPYRSHNRMRNDFRSPSYQADKDEALRASLTTLLSCAAAAKSLPGRRGNVAGPSSGEPMMGAGVGPSSQPMELRLVPESDLGNEALSPGGHNAPKSSSRSHQPTARTSSNSSAQSQPASVSSKEAEKVKRATATAQSRSQRATKKKRNSVSAVDDNTVTWISPATLTWVLGTGVVLLVSVVGFGAGFVVGREVGRSDLLSSTSGSSGAISAGYNSSCGTEIMRSTGSGTLRRWRWGTGMGRSVVA